MVEKKIKKPLYKNIGLIIIVGVIIWIAYQYYSYEADNKYSPEKSVKESLEEKNYEVLDVFYYALNSNLSYASVTMKALGSRDEQVWAGVETLSYVYTNTSDYMIKILTDSQTCSYRTRSTYYSFYQDTKQLNDDGWGYKDMTYQIDSEGKLGGFYYNRLVDYINKKFNLLIPFELKANGSMVDSSTLYIIGKYQIRDSEQCS